MPEPLTPESVRSFSDDTKLTQAEVKRILSELRKEENFLLAHLGQVDNGHEAIEEVNVLIDFYENWAY
jgi:hypothetical protein